MGKIFNIQKFCTNDGPGIRTTVFFKGCPLRCEWCHNPESQSFRAELLYSPESCVSCLRCVGVCESGAQKSSDGTHIFAREDCVGCLKCASLHCPALEAVGRDETPEAVLAEVLKDRAFYETSAGGITLSGGEPFAQYEFALELLRLAKASGLHTAVETCGYVATERLVEAAEYVDLFLYDVKETDSELHERFTGVDNSLILANLRRLDSLGARVILRAPIIPGRNARDEHYRALASLANELSCVEAIELEPYHSFGESKHTRLGREYLLAGASLDDSELSRILELMRDLTAKKSTIPGTQL